LLYVHQNVPLCVSRCRILYEKQTGGRGDVIRFPAREGVFLVSKAVRLAEQSTQPSIQWLLENCTPSIRRPGCESDRSPPSSAELYNDIYRHFDVHIHGPPSYFIPGKCIYIYIYIYVYIYTYIHKANVSDIQTIIIISIIVITIIIAAIIIKL
jgi:hypothetical protein